MLNWTSSTEISSTGRTDAYSIGASDGCRKIGRPGFGTSLCASGDQVKKEAKHRMNRRCQERLLTFTNAPDLYTASAWFVVAFPLEYSPKVYQSMDRQ